MYHCFFIHLSVYGHLGCFHVLATINSAAMNIGVHVSFSILVSSGYMPSSGIAGSYGGFIPSFLRNLHTVFHSGYIIFTSNARGFPFLHTLSSIYCLYFLMIVILTGVTTTISHCSFDLHFSNNYEQCCASFYVFVSHLHVFFGEMSV